MPLLTSELAVALSSHPQMRQKGRWQVPFEPGQPLGAETYANTYTYK